VELAGRVALVTGAGRRVGRAIAEGLAESGCDVAVHLHGSAAGAQDTIAAIRGLGRRAEAFPADLRDADAAKALADRVVAAFGRLDIQIGRAHV